MAEYTQEQIDAMIAEAKKGLFSEEDLNRKVTAEVDRRVETGIQKGLETQRIKWEEEYSERAKLTAEEIAKKDLEEKAKQVQTQSSELSKRANKLDAKEMLSDANIPKSHYDGFINMLVTDDAEQTKVNVQNFINMFNATKNTIETEVKTQYTNVPKPKQGMGNDGVVTKESFNKMSYKEKVEFKETHPDLYKEFIK